MLHRLKYTETQQQRSIVTRINMDKRLMRAALERWMAAGHMQGRNYRNGKTSPFINTSTDTAPKPAGIPP